MADKPYRSIVKGISWRVLGTIDTIVLSWLVTGKMEFALSIGFIEVFTKIVLYTVHERVWERIPFGREKDKEPEYFI